MLSATPPIIRSVLAVAAGIFAAGGFMNFMKIPHPTWFVVASMIAFVVAPFLGTRLAGRRAPKAGKRDGA